MNKLDRVVSKLTSGQWVLTVSCAFVFAWCAVNELLPKEATAAILGSVFASYFQRKREQETNGKT